MKKLVLIAAALVLMLPAAFAQKGLHAGVKASGISTWMFNSDDSDAGAEFDYVSTFGYQVGGSFNYHFTDGLGAGVDVIYANQGQKYESYGVEGKRSLKYLKLPVLLHFNTDPEAVAYFQGYFGPQFGFLLSAEDELPVLGTTDTKEFYKSVNIGLALGLGVGFNVHENFKITFGLRFDGTPGNVEDTEGTLFADRAVTRNVTGGLELGLIYVLPVK